MDLDLIAYDLPGYTHAFFALSFLLPGLVAAWDATRRDGRQLSKAPLWIGLGFAIPAAVACVPFIGESFAARAYLGVYGLLLLVPVSRLFAGGDGAKVAGEEILLAVVEEEAMRAPPEKKCVPRRLASGGSAIPQKTKGSSGIRKLWGSNYYEWDLMVDVDESVSNAITVKASAVGGYIPWWGIDFRPRSKSNAVTGTVYCREKEGGCAAKGLGGRIEPDGDVFDIAIAVVAKGEGDEVTLEAEAAATIEGHMAIETVEVSGSAEGEVGGAKLKGEVKTVIKMRNEARASVKLSRAYSYVCEHPPEE